MQTKVFIVSLGVALLLLISSCTPFDRMNDQAKDWLKTEEGFFRGISFDVSPEEVQKTEDALITEAGEYYLSYEQVPDRMGEHIEIEYSFNNDKKLDFIATYYVLPDAETVEAVTKSVQSYLDKKYGEGKKDELGWHIWEIDDKTGEPGTIEIVMNSDIDMAGESYGVDMEMVKYYDYEQE